jgi:hypothetical protein
MAVVLRCEKHMEKLPSLFLDSLFPKTEIPRMRDAEDEEEDIRRYWMILGTEEDIFL